MGKLHSPRARTWRLKVMKMYREEAGQEVYVRCKVFPWDPAYDRFMERYSERLAAGLTHCTLCNGWHGHLAC